MKSTQWKKRGREVAQTQEAEGLSRSSKGSTIKQCWEMEPPLQLRREEGQRSSRKG